MGIFTTSNCHILVIFKSNFFYIKATYFLLLMSFNLKVNHSSYCALVEFVHISLLMLILMLMLMLKKIQNKLIFNE